MANQSSGHKQTFSKTSILSAMQLTAAWSVVSEATIKNCFRKVEISGKSAEEAINPLSADPTKWSNTLEQFVGNFVKLALKGLMIKMIRSNTWQLKNLKKPSTSFGKDCPMKFERN